MNNKIRIITSYSIAEEPVIRNRIIPFLNVAREKGIFVEIVSTDMVSSEIISNLGFQHSVMPDRNIKPIGFVRRAIFEFNQARRLISNSPNDVGIEIITIPSMFLLFVSIFCSKERFHVDVRDLTWEYLEEKNLFSRLSKYIFRKLATIALNRAKSISVTNDSEFSYVKKLLSDKSKDVLKITNGVSKSQFDSLSNIACYPIKNCDDEVFQVSYIGNVGIAQNLTVLVDAAKRLPRIKFNIVGSGTDFNRVNNHVINNDVKNVRLYGRVSWEEVLDVYQHSDVLYAQLSSSFSSATPSKLYEYLSTGKTIIYGGGKQAVDLLSGFDNNFVIAPDDVDSLVREISLLTKKGPDFSLNNQMNIKSNFIREVAVNKLFDKVIL